MGVFLNKSHFDFRAWLAFLSGVVICVLIISMGELRKEPSGLLVFDAASTQTGSLKILYTVQGVLTDPGWSVNFPQANTSQTFSFPLHTGKYDLIGFKPLVEANGQVSISNLKIISELGVSAIDEDGFVAINQLDKISSNSADVLISPAQGATDPFGAFPNLHVSVPKATFSLTALLSLAAGKFGLIAVFLIIMYGLSGNLPFARGSSGELKQHEPRPSQWLGFIAVGLIILYLRNAHSIIVPVLYTEDGVWSAGLINRGFFDMLFNARADYFVFGNIVLLGVSQLINFLLFGLNLTYLPHFISFFSMLFYAVLAITPVVLLRGLLRIEARLLLWLLVLLVPLGDSSYEILGRLSNIGYVFLFLSFCLLVFRHNFLSDGPSKQIVVIDVVLFICANTNPLCYLLITISFSIEAWNHWKTHSDLTLFVWFKKYLTRFSVRSAFILLFILFFMALWLLLREKGEYTFLAGDIVLTNIPEMIVARTFLYPIIFPIYSYFNNITSSILLLVVIATIIWLIKGKQREKSILTSAVLVLILNTGVLLESRPGLTAVLDHFRSSYPDRYYFGLTLFVYLVITSALSAGFGGQYKCWRRIVANLLAGGLIALYIGNSPFLFEFAKPRFKELPTHSFYDEMKNAYVNGGESGSNGIRYKVALNPAPWVTHFPAVYVVSTVNGVPTTPQFSIPYLQPNLSVIKATDIAHKYDGKVIRKAAAIGREAGWFYVLGGSRSWITDSRWLKQKNLSPADVIEISREDFAAIPDSGVTLK
jgi:hypothetical protein